VWLKLSYKDQVKVIKHKCPFTLGDVNKLVEQNFSLQDAIIRFRDSKGDMIPITSEAELQYLIENNKDTTSIEIFVSGAKGMMQSLKMFLYR
jgi:hypothetical protein